METLLMSKKDKSKQSTRLQKTNKQQTQFTFNVTLVTRKYHTTYKYLHIYNKIEPVNVWMFFCGKKQTIS